MKRAANLSWLLGRDMPWLSWWQELVVNWVSSWATVSTVIVIAADGEEQGEWHLPTDTDLHRLQLEELLDR